MNTIKKTDIAPELLQAAITYNPETGELFWKNGLSEFLSDIGPGGISARISEWNTKYAGQPAFCYLNKEGYFRGTFRNKKLLAHRVIWAIQTGQWPKNQIDHINGCRSDNRWENLREATHSQNGQNQRPSEGTSSKYIGVGWRKDTKMWAASIKVNDKRYHLGYFRNEDEAALERDIAAWAKGGAYAYFNFPDLQHDEKLAGKWERFEKNLSYRRRLRPRPR